MRTSASPIAVQLYTLRAAAERDFPAALARIAAIGYLGVETVGLHGMAPAELRSRLDDLGLALTSAYIGLPAARDMARVLDEQQATGAEVVVCGLGPEAFSSLAAVHGAAEQFNEFADAVAGRGMALGYHNHWWEFTGSLDGRKPIDVFADAVGPAVFLEIDIYWLQASGIDAIGWLRTNHDRVRRFHVKDGPGTQTDPMCAVGQGSIDVDGLLAAVPEAEWHIVELDECAGDMFEAVEASYGYLTARRLSRGRDG